MNLKCDEKSRREQNTHEIRAQFFSIRRADCLVSLPAQAKHSPKPESCEKRRDIYVALIVAATQPATNTQREREFE